MACRGVLALGAATALMAGCNGDDVSVAASGAAAGTGSTGGGLDASSSESTAAGESTTEGVLDESTTASSGTSTGASVESSDGLGPLCGDGNRDPGEECDDGDANADTKACKLDCTAARCGDGFTHDGVEECDDANDVNNDGCTDMCILLEACGDGEIQDPEECDNGPENADNGACKSDCQLNVCGDGDLYNGVEICDDGNEENNDGCSTLCAPPTCGDGFVQTVNAELCDDGDVADGDECNSDCFSAGVWTVTHNGRGSNNDSAADAAVDAFNNVVVVGEVFDAVEGVNLWVRSYNGNGQVNWTDTYHGVTSDRAFGVAIAENTDIWVAGSSFTLGEGRDIWLRRYDADGTPGEIYTVNGDDDNADEALGIAIDPNGDLLVVGYITTVANGRDIWLRKYTPAGAAVWTETVTSPGNFLDEGRAVATDVSGNVFVTGYIWADTEARDIWVRGYDPDGTELWTDTVSGADMSQDEGNGIATDTSGNVIVTGFLDDGPNGRDIWTRKYDLNGDEVWTETYNAPQNGTDAGEDVEVDADDNIIVGGSVFRGTQQDNAWIGKYDPDGNLLWESEYNNSEAFLSDRVLGLAVDSEQNIAAVGFETRSDIGEARNIWIRYILQ